MPFVLKEGQGALHRVHEKQNDRGPDYKGELNIGGKTWRIAGWIKLSAKGNKWLSLSIEEPRTEQPVLTTPPAKAVPQREPIDPDSDVPF